MSESAIDVTGFLLVCEELERLSGRHYSQIVVLQIGALLKACINRTPARKVGDIAKRVSRRGGFIEFADGTIISTFKKADHATMFLDDSTYPQFADRWPKDTPPPTMKGGKSWHVMNGNRHWSNQRWAKFENLDRQRIEEMKRKYVETLAARGLAKKTWYQIAEDLGLDLSVPNYVSGAKDPKGRPFKEGLARQLLEQGSYIVEIINFNPLVVGKLNGREILEGALRDREKAFMIEMEKGVFHDVAMRAKRYPGIFVN